MDSRAKLMNIYGGALLSRCLAVAAELGIADQLVSGPKTSDELARLTNAHEQSLYRLLRYLASVGIFAEDADGKWRQTPDSEPLVSNVEGSLRNVVRSRWQDVMWPAYMALPETIHSGKTAFGIAFDQPFFVYLQAHEDKGAAFNAAMAGSSERENISIVTAYDFSDVNVVMDVAGGKGGLLSHVLRAHTHVHGQLFEQESVLTDPDYLNTHDLKGRYDLIPGDFFESIPTGADIYTLKRILHDWADENAIRILSTIAAAMKPQSKVLVIDAVIKPGNAPDPNKALDVGMMVLVEGRERTEDDFQILFNKAGLRLTRIIPTQAPSTMSLVEGMKV